MGIHRDLSPGDLSQGPGSRCWSTQVLVNTRVFVIRPPGPTLELRLTSLSFLRLVGSLAPSPVPRQDND